MKIIGLCGGSGSGKGTVSDIFGKYGVAAIDTDAVYHDITSASSPCVEELSLRFGNNVFLPNGGLNRRVLRDIVFADDSHKLLDDLGAITHKHILAETKRLIEGYRSSGAPAVIIDAPLLFESRFSELCDFVIAVVADVDIRVSRIVARDGITVDLARRRIEAQISDAVLIERSDFVVYNDGSLEDLEAQVEKVANII